MSTHPKNENVKTSIYVLKDPKTQEIRYVGKTTQSLVARLGLHIGDAKKYKHHRANWIRKILDSGTLPIIEEIDSCPYEESANLEIYYIAKYRAEGYNLVNDTDGGEGNLGLKQSEETVLKRKTTLRKLTPQVYQYDLTGKFIKKWNSASDAAEALHIKSSGITRCLRKERFKYKEYIWKTELVENAAKEYLESQQRKHERNISKGGYTLSFLSRIISQEAKIEQFPWIYVYNTNHTLVYEAISSRDASSYINDLLNRQDIDISSRITTCILNHTRYYDKFYISNTPPMGHQHTKKKALLIITDGEETFYGVLEATDKLGIEKYNIINNLKGKTKSINTVKGKRHLTWKLNNDFSRLYEKSYGLSTEELEEIAKILLNLLLNSEIAKGSEEV